MTASRIPLRILPAVCAALVLAGCVSTPRSSKTTAKPSIRFRDVTTEVGIDFRRVNGAFGQHYMPETMGGGGAFIDYDNDGWQDVLLVNGDWWPGHPLPGPRPTLALYHNDQNGTFSDVTQTMGLNISLQGMGAAVGDFDNDGYDDLYVTGVGGNRLFRNDGGRRFVDVTEEAGVAGTGWSTGAAWLDYDNDGWLDLFVCHYLKWSPETDIFCGSVEKAYCRPQEYPGESCRLYRNRGVQAFRPSGVQREPEHPNTPTPQHPLFEDVTQRAGLLNHNAKALGVCVLDLNGDRYPDLIVANDMEPNFVYQNDGNGTFTEIGFKTGIALDDNGRTRAGMGIDTAWYRNDTTPGLAIGNFAFEGIAFYDLEGEQPYAEHSKQAGLFTPSYPYITFGLFFADFDNDGWADLFVTNGHIEDNVSRTNPGQTYKQPGLLFRNRRDGTFEDVSQTAGPGVTQPLVGRGACRGDFDNDGKTDILLIPNIGPPRLLHNRTQTGNHWLKIRLVGTKSNRNGFGAVVRVQAGGVTRTARAASGSSYLSESDHRLLFGLGAAAQANRVTVRWPGGLEETWESLAADRIVTLTEGTAGARQNRRAHTVPRRI